MTFKKRCATAIIVLCALFVSLAPLYAVDDSNVITLSQAKELARTKSRSMQNLAVTQDKLKVEAKIAYDNYFGTNIQSNIDGYTARIKQLQDQIGNLDPIEDADEIAALQSKVLQIENIVSGLKSALPATENASSALRVQWRAKDYAAEDMAKMISDAEKELELRVESMYFGLLNTNNTIMVQEKNLDLLGVQLQVERLKFALGLSTGVDEKSIAVQYDSLYKILDDLRNAQQLLVWQLNDLMGRDVTSQLNVKAEQITPVLMMINYEDILNNAIKNSLRIEQKKREIEDYDADARKETNSYERSSLLLSEEIAKLALEDLMEITKVTVKTLVNTLENSYKTWENKSLAKTKAEAAYKNDKAKYELGLISKIQYMGSEMAYLQAVNEEMTAAQNWCLARNKTVIAKQGVLVQ